MKLLENIRYISVEDDDRNMVPGLEFGYRFDEAEHVLGLIEGARSAEADKYLAALELGNTAMQAYYQDTISQMTNMALSVAPVASQLLICQIEEHLSRAE